MHRLSCLLFPLILCLSTAALAQDRPHKARRRAPPSPDTAMPVRKPAVIERFEPTAGPPGTIVVIFGRAFDPTTRVRFNGRWLRIIQRSDTELRVRLRRNASTDHFVVTKAGFSDLTSAQPFSVIRPPMIASFAPPQGMPGTQVTLRGANFLQGDRVLLGSVEIPPLAVHPERVIIRIPQGAASNRFGIRREGQVVAWSGARFEVLGLPPTISSFSPERGPRGTLVRISGQNFEPTDFVTLGGHRVAIRSRTPSSIEVMISRQRSGRFAIHGRGRRHAESAGVFSVTLPLAVHRFSPAFGPAGTTITIQGAGFVSGVIAYLGNSMLTIRNISDAAIVATLPAGVSSGPISVRRDAERAVTRGIFEVIAAPTITNMTPTTGPPGTQVTLSGRHFMADARVLLAGQPLPIVRRQLPTTLLVSIPANARTSPMVVVTRGGSSQSSIPFTVTHFAVLSSFFPLHGVPGTRVTIRGANFHRTLRVWLKQTALPVLQHDDSSLVVEIPRGAASGRFELESYGRRIVSKMPFTVDEPQPEMVFSFAPAGGKRGSEVTLTLTPPSQDVLVFFDGRPLPKKVLQGGRYLVVIIPADARSGYFEVEYKGLRYRAKQIFHVR